MTVVWQRFRQCLRNLPDGWIPVAAMTALAGLTIGNGLVPVVANAANARVQQGGAYLLTLGILLFVSSMYVIYSSWIRGSRQRTGSGGEAETGSAESVGSQHVQRPPRTSTRRRLGTLLVTLTAYVTLLPLLGFLIATGIFIVLYLRLIARHGWLKSAFIALLIDLVFTFGFTSLGISLPTSNLIPLTIIPLTKL